VLPLPVRAPYDLVIVQGYWSGREQGFSYPLLREMNARQNVVEGIFASGGANIKDLQIGGRTSQTCPAENSRRETTSASSVPIPRLAGSSANPTTNPGPRLLPC